MSLTWALMTASSEDVPLMTDSPSHHALLIRRLKARADYEAEQLPPTSYSATKRRLVELKVIEALAPERELARMPMDAVLAYRQASGDARRELSKWIDRLTERTEHREWDEQFAAELDQIVREVRAIAETPSRWQVAGRSLKSKAGLGMAASSSSALLGLAFFPGVTKAAALALGAPTIGSAVSAFLDDLTKVPPERNAAAYLLNARHKRVRA